MSTPDQTITEEDTFEDNKNTPSTDNQPEFNIRQMMIQYNNTVRNLRSKLQQEAPLI